MDKLSYLLSLIKEKPNEVRDTWSALGSLVCTNKTKMYIRDSIFLVKCDEYPDGVVAPPLDGAIVYCCETHKEKINWDAMTTQGANSIVYTHDGVMSSHFRVLLTRNEISKIAQPINEDYTPFPFDDVNSIDCSINISDLELKIILGETGVPFFRIEELEYSRNDIIQLCIFPIIQQYYAMFPKVKQECLGRLGPNEEFKIEIPENAYYGVPFYTTGGTGGNKPTPPCGALSTMMTGYSSIGSSYTGNGSGILKYNKPVPGWTGGADFLQNYVDQRAAAQGVENYMRHEKIMNVLDENGKRYIQGFSSTGGYLNVKWHMWDRDWSHIPFIDLTDVRKLCTAKVLRNLGMLRALIANDAPSKIDYSLYNSRADSLEQAVINIWNESSHRLVNTPARGGF